MGILTLAATLVPTIVGWIGGSEAGDTAEAITNAALKLTGTDSEEAAEAALRGSPELMAKFKTRLEEIELETFREGTKRLEIINQTMRTEIAGQGFYKTGWRPAFGWAAAGSWMVVMAGTMFLLGWAVVNSPANLAAVITAISQVLGQMFPMWGVALAVLGVAVWKRSDDKALAVTGEKRTSGLMRAARDLRKALNTKTEGAADNG